MPLFAYRCNACAHEFEILSRFHETPACPSCGGADVERQLSLIARPAAGGEARGKLRGDGRRDAVPELPGACGPDVTSAAALLGGRRIIIPANGLEFEAFEAGEGDRLALLLHGFPQHAIMWRHLVAPLAAAGYRVWAVNQRGYGETSRPREREAYSLDALASDVAALIDAANPALGCAHRT